MSGRQHHPPRWATWLLKKLGSPRTAEEVQGDLHELYQDWVKELGVKAARQRYVRAVFNLLRPFSSPEYNVYAPPGFHPMAMIKNYLRIAWRSLFRQWQYSFITITGLAVAMVCCLFIVLYVRNEQRFDRYHGNADRIYRVVRNMRNNNDQYQLTASTQQGVAYTLRNDLAETESAAAIMPQKQLLLTVDDKQFYEEHIFGADSDFFEVFTFPLVKGLPREVLKQDRSMVLTEATAQKYFGSIDPIGRIIHIENKGDFHITGIVRNVPPNSHFHFDILIPVESFEERHKTTWEGGPHFYTYVKLKNAVNPDAFQSRLEGLAKKYRSQSLDQYRIQPLTSIHLGPSMTGEPEPPGDKSTLKILLTIAGFIIFIAAINYINLATARSAKRAKEVGIRKTSGAFRGALIGQFLAESVLITLLAFGLALVLAYFIATPFEEVSGRPLNIMAQDVIPLAGWSIAFVLVTGILAGLYPAFYLSSFSPAQVLRGGPVKTIGSAAWLRKSLVAMQFTISIGLIIGTIVVTQQMKFIRDARLGFDKEHVLVLPNAGRLAGRDAMENKIKNLAGVMNIGASTSVIGQSHWSSNIHTQTNPQHQRIDFVQIDYSYLETLNIRLLQGRNFSPAFPRDTVDTIILNETAVHALNLTDPIGTRLIWDENRKEPVYAEVIGVVNDFHYSSFREPILPFAFLIRNNFFVQEDFTSALFIKIQGKSVTPVLRSIESIWKQHVPHRPFTYYYLDDSFNKLHQSEQRFNTLFSWLTGLAIFIACLGLFALIAFVVEQRAKEISIRKVMGASVGNLVLLINKEFIVLVLVALAIASPIAVYALNQWLNKFVYRIELQGWMFAAAGLLALIIALITTGIQSVKASLANPVDSLKSD